MTSRLTSSLLKLGLTFQVLLFFAPSTFAFTSIQCDPETQAAVKALDTQVLIRMIEKVKTLTDLEEVLRREAELTRKEHIVNATLDKRQQISPQQLAANAKAVGIMQARNLVSNEIAALQPCIEAGVVSASDLHLHR